MIIGIKCHRQLYPKFVMINHLLIITCRKSSLFGVDANLNEPDSKFIPPGVGM